MLAYFGDRPQARLGRAIRGFLACRHDQQAAGALPGLAGRWERARARGGRIAGLVVRR